MVPVFVQVPVESHVCGWFGLRGVHCLAPGVQTPAHAPATQEKGQAEITHAPDGLHVCTDVPTQPVVPGVQMAGPASGLAKSTVMAAVGAGFTTRVIAGVPSNDDADAPMRAHVRNVRRAAASSRSPVARHRDNVLFFVGMAQEVALVLIPEPTSLVPISNSVVSPTQRWLGLSAANWRSRMLGATSSWCTCGGAARGP